MIMMNRLVNLLQFQHQQDPHVSRHLLPQVAPKMMFPSIMIPMEMRIGNWMMFAKYKMLKEMWLVPHCNL